MKTVEELRKLDSKKLQETIIVAQKKLFKAKFEIANGQSKNQHLIGQAKKEIARAKTLLREREIEEILAPAEKTEEK